MPPRRLDATLRAALSFRLRDPRSDAELLAHFLTERNEAAFEALVLRHAPAVRAACRGWLRSAADIDDAAQATFLVLVQRAGSIRNHAALGAWLCRVAVNVSRRLRRQQRPASPLPEDVPGPGTQGPNELGDLLAEEVARLPEKYRLPVQLCYLAGLTTTEAALYLGWPKGTVLTRLAWARERLRKSLGRRGVSAEAFAGLAGLPAPVVGKQWVSVTARAATSTLAGQSPVGAGASERTISLAKGVERAMFLDKVKVLAVAALLALGGIGLGIHHWASAANGPGPLGKRANEDAEAQAAGKPEAKEPKGQPVGPVGRGARPSRRREAVIRLPVGTFVKEVEVGPYGSGRLTWTYEEDRVLGLIEASAMGGEIELATEAEYSLSSNGTIYGIITSARLKHLRLPQGKEFEQLQPYAKLWPAVEPLVNEVVMDMPFSYQFRVQGNRLIISNFRMLLAGPNPLGKLGAMTMLKEAGAVLVGCQALGTALEGTYTAEDEKERPGRRPFPRERGGANARSKR